METADCKIPFRFPSSPVSEGVISNDSRACGGMPVAAHRTLTLCVPAAEDVVQRRPVSCLKESDNEAKTEESTVRFCAGESKGENGPADFEEGNPD